MYQWTFTLNNYLIVVIHRVHCPILSRDCSKEDRERTPEHAVGSAGNGRDRRRATSRCSFTGNPVWTTFTRRRKEPRQKHSTWRFRPSSPETGCPPGDVFDGAQHIPVVDLTYLPRGYDALSPWVRHTLAVGTARSFLRRTGEVTRRRMLASRFTGNPVCVPLPAHTCRLRNLTGNPVCLCGTLVPSIPSPSTPPNGGNRNVFHRKSGVRLATPDTGRPPSVLPHPTSISSRRRRRPPPSTAPPRSPETRCPPLPTRVGAPSSLSAHSPEGVLSPVSETFLTVCRIVFSQSTSETNNIHKRLLYSVDNLYIVW